MQAKVIDRCHEIFGIDVGRGDVARFAAALAGVREDPHAQPVADALTKEGQITWSSEVNMNNEEGTCAAVNVSWGNGEEFDYSGYVKENNYEFRKRLPWLLNLLDQVVPETTIRMTKAEAEAQEDKAYLFTVETSMTDGEVMPGKSPSTSCLPVSML